MVALRSFVEAKKRMNNLEEGKVSDPTEPTPYTGKTADGATGASLIPFSIDR